MEAAVVAGDQEGYLALVDLSDPVFAVEHTRWTDEWAGELELNEYSLAVHDVATEAGEATAVMTVTWATADQDTRTAELDVRFTLDAARGWRYAGEEWVTTEVEHFVVRVAPGLEAEQPAIVDALPDVFVHVTESLDYSPGGVMEIKLYTGPAELVSTVLLSLPDIHGWNEPGESLKLRLDPDVPSLTPAIAHEFTHFSVFDRAGTQRTRMPWWLDEGIATFVAYHFEGAEIGALRIDQVRGWLENGELADWTEMAVFEETPQELWPHVYGQGYVMARYVTETFGAPMRNAWLAAMATEMDIEEATETHLGMTFEELDAQFQDWLRD